MAADRGDYLLRHDRGCIPEPRDAEPFTDEREREGEKIVRRFLGDECSPPGPNYYSHGHDEVFVPGVCCANFRCDQF